MSIHLPTRPPGILACSILFSALAIITLLLRLYTRLKVTATFGADDVFMILATCFALAMYAVMAAGDVKYGWNRHVWDIPLSMFTANRKLNMAYEILFSISSCFTKLSLLWFCRRIVGNASKAGFMGHYVALVCSMALITLCLVLFVLLALLQCRPLKASWDLHRDYPYHCFSGAIFIFATSIVNSITDLLCTLLPMLLIMRLSMRTPQKLAAMSLFAIGILVNIAAALRIYFFVRAGKSGDPTWNDYQTWIAGDLEIGLGLIATNAPSLRALLASYIPRLLSHTRGRNASSPSPAIFGSAPRAAQPPCFQSSWPVASIFNGTDTQALSIVSVEAPKDHFILNGIEVTRTVELDAFCWEGQRDNSLEDALRPYQL
ncbi:hypothetical protein MPDQ_007483 [Monascus purpureus]|uniref:Rhodopsin domain-containing protein n=1 Tax=Monascus purpureus TaxID=5098 RepID=A0A507R583_MONPU|nr:hypothetical protein MPDQ_007483 [Monascus purpureus]